MAITTPPFRTSLLTANGVPFATDNGDIQTTRDWWMYWNQLTDRSNANSKLATAGTHGDRPMPESMPDGALYYENDRGVLYANTLGVWQYVAGTMYGTLSPVDERPNDLGTHDAGFDFRTIVAPAREFLWSQTAWIEVTPVQYGPHSARPDPATIVQGALYVEGDRGGVIYQVESPAGTNLWQYLAGTMWGSLSPDQRPTDLGTHDAGFDFRTTTAPPREFIWNQTAWVEVTPVGGVVNLTHPNVVTKVGSTAGSIVEGCINDQGPTGNITVTAAGNVGIGTASPIGRLSVASAGAWVPPSTVGMSGIGMVVSGSYAGGIGMIDGAATFGMWGQGGDFYFGNGAISGALTGRMIIAANGNVGIGPTPIPSATLELAEASQPKLGFYSTGGNANQQRGALVYDGGQNTPGGGWTFQRRTDAGGFAANLVSIIVSTGRVGILTTSPGYPLDVVGDVNCSSGLYRFNGAAIAAITTRTDVTASRVLNSGVYQNTYGRPMFVNVTASVNASQYMQLLTDGGNPPGAIAAVATNTNTTGTSGTYTVSAWVMQGHFYKVLHSGGSLTIWIEWT